jgi:hypothetical protein
MNSFLIDVLKRVHLAMLKQESLHVTVSFDGGCQYLPLKDLLASMNTDGTFDIVKYVREKLNLSVLLQSHVLIILALLFMDSTQLSQIQTL